MAEKGNNYTLLINKLDQFIRKYYINQVIRGALYFVGLAFLLFLLFNILEYYFYFPKLIRKTFFYSFIGVSALSMFYWVVYPLSKYFSLGETISHEKAASIIGTHFTDVQDRLLNILQLKKQGESAAQKELIEASIDQKSETIKLVPFKNAIDLRNNRKYLKYALPPFLVFLFLLFAAPSLITDSTFRIINNNTEFERDAPFQFLLENEAYDVVQYSDFPFTVDIEGEALPEELFIEVDKYQYRMKKVAPNKFEYLFKNVQKDTPFRLFSGSVQSKELALNVLAKPNLLNFSLYLDYPAYTGSKDETLSNIGDVSIPAGTVINWEFESINTDQIAISFGESQELMNQKSAEHFAYSKRIKEDRQYKVYLSNKQIATADSFLYQINVIPDQYPSIQMEQFQDSLEENLVYFIGSATDDYGIANLSFNYTIIDEDGQSQTPVSEKLLGVSGKTASYEYILDVNELGLLPGQNLTYYFEVKDNDQINGSKSSKTGILNYRKASPEELKEQAKEKSEDVKKKLDEALKETKEIKDAFKKLKDKLLEKKELDWQAKKELEKLFERQKELQEKMKQAKQDFQEKMKNEELMNKSEETQQKEEKMEKMFDELMNEEVNELMEKIQELMDELEKDPAMDVMKEMEQEDQTLEKELERLKELYKQLELEKDVEQLADELNKLAEEQEKLSEETLNEEKPAEELQKKQEELNEKFDALKEDMKEIEKKNEELEKPKELGDDNQEQMEDIDQDMEKAEEQLEQKKNKGAGQKQKDAGEKMKKMASSLQSNMQSGEMEQMAEDMKVIRQLLENLITLSFDQEDLINAFNLTDEHTPKFVELVQDQFKIKDDFGLVADSLQELAKRQPSIETFVIEKMTDVQNNLEEGMVKLEDRQKSVAEENQRKTMTGLNDLALMLNESMNQMQQQMSGMMQGSQMCNNPGGTGAGKPGKVPSDKITEGQEGLNKQMKDMMEKMQQGKGKEKGGKEGKDGQDGMSAEFAKAAAKQAALRKALEEMKKENAEQGKGDGGLQEIIEQMDQIETDLVNKRLNNEMLARQKDILTRLLEADKADRQREMDDKRKSESGTDKVRQFPPNLDAYLKEREAEIDQYKTVSPALKPYYKFLVEQYYKTLKSAN